MHDAKATADQFFLEMRWRCLSLAADLDRIQRCPGGAELLKSDERFQTLYEAIALLTSDSPDRAEQVEMLFSDKSPPPSR